MIKQGQPYDIARMGLHFLTVLLGALVIIGARSCLAALSPEQCLLPYNTYLTGANLTVTELPGGVALPPQFPKDPSSEGSEGLSKIIDRSIWNRSTTNRILLTQGAVYNMTLEELLPELGLSVDQLQAAPQEAAFEIVLEAIKQYAKLRERQLPSTTPPCDLVCERDQRAALIALYNSMDGQQWRFPPGATKWPIDSLGSDPANYPPYSHCSWHGVACCTASHTLSYQVFGRDGRPIGFSNSLDDFDVLCAKAGGVAAVRLVNMGLTGVVPDSVLPQLASLEYLDLATNNLTGTLTYAWTSLHLLKAISLSDNLLFGPLPDLGFWTSFPYMRYLALAGNRFSGTLPTTLPAMPLLRSLVLDSNKIGGIVPEEWAVFPSITEISADNNLISGQWDVTDRVYFVGQGGSAGFYGMDRNTMRSLSVRSNKLSGPFPAQIITLPLEFLDMGNNQLDGPLPAALATNPLLQTLKLNGNRFSGPLPPEILKWGLTIVSLESNLLSGPIPDSIGTVTTLRSFHVDNNTALVGPLPASLSRLPQMEELDVRWTSLQTLPGQFNFKGELLPEFLTFDRSMVRPVIEPDGSFANMRCYPVVGVRGTRWAQTSVLVSPWLFSFQFCNCSEGYKPTWVPAGSASNVIPSNASGALQEELSCVMIKPPKNQDFALAAVLVPILVTLLLLGGGLFLGFRYRESFARARTEYAKRRGPPGAGKPVTLVLTDVEGSTELWEAFPHVMSEALDLHDRALRSLMANYYGYEVSTEGDSFLVAFHEPSDALAWCLAAQECLMQLPWPAKLLTHPKAAEAREGEPACSPPPPPNPKAVPRTVTDVRGYRAEHEALKRYDRWWRPAASGSGRSMSLWGALRSRVSFGSSPDLKAQSQRGSAENIQVASLAAESLTSNGPNSSPATGVSPTSPPLSLLSPPGSPTAPDDPPMPSPEAEGAPSPDALGLDRPTDATSEFVSSPQSSLAPASPVSSLQTASNVTAKPSGANLGTVLEDGKEGQDGHTGGHEPGTLLFRGLRVRMGLATGVPHHVSRHRVTQRREYFGDVVWRVQTVSDMGHGGQVLMDEETFEGLHGRMEGVLKAVVAVLGAPGGKPSSQKGFVPPRPSRKAAVSKGSKESWDAAREKGASKEPKPSSSDVLEGSGPSTASRLSEARISSSLAAPKPDPRAIVAPTTMLDLESLGLARRMASTPGRFHQEASFDGSRRLSSFAARTAQLQTIRVDGGFAEDGNGGPSPDDRAGPTAGSKPGRGWGLGSKVARLFGRTPSLDHRAASVGEPSMYAESLGRAQRGRGPRPGSASFTMSKLLHPLRTLSCCSSPFAPRHGKGEATTHSSRSSFARIMLMDSGEHKVETPVTSRRLHLYQALYVGLEERARVFPPIDSAEVLSPGYLDAPSARFAPLNQICRHGADPSLCPSCAPRLPPLPPVTVVFCAPDGLAELRAWDRSVADKAQATWRSAIRRLLAECGGYEAQEADGAFLLAFACPAAAIRWCLIMQWKLMLLPWPEALLTHPLGLEEWAEVETEGLEAEEAPRRMTDASQETPRAPPSPVPGLGSRHRFSRSFSRGSASESRIPSPLPHGPALTEDQAKGLAPLTEVAQEVHGQAGTMFRRRLLFRGLRARMGMYEGVPARIRPHLSTGRADYFGPLVNRAARIAYAVAAPGQILAELNLAVHAVEVFREHGARCNQRQQSGPGGLLSAIESAFEREDQGPDSTTKVEISDVGLYALKGVVGQWRLAQINCSGLSGRSFRGYLPKRKGTKLEEGTGLIATVDIPRRDLQIKENPCTAGH